MEVTTQLIEKSFRAYYRALCLYAWDVVKSEADAEDVVQGVFAEMLERCAEGKRQEVEDVRRYLAVSVRNAGRRWLRDRQGRETGVDVEELSAEEEERVERAEREARLWDWVDASGTRTVDSHVKALRHKLGSQTIRTVHGVGYAFEPPEQHE